MNTIDLLTLKNRKNNLGVSIYLISFLLRYARYKLNEKEITRVLRRDFKNSLEVAIVKNYEKDFDNFKYINTINDVLNAKLLLKELYFLESTDFSLKTSILYAINEYIEESDEAFYLLCLKNLFEYDNINFILDIILCVESALYYIEKIKFRHEGKNFFWLKELEDKSIAIMHNRIKFFNHPNKIDILRLCKRDFSSNYFGLRLKYKYVFPLLINNDSEIGVTVCFDGDENPTIDMMFSFENTEIFLFSSMPLKNLMKIFFDIFITYENHFKDKKSYVYSIKDDLTNNQLKSLNFKYLKRNGDYYLTFNSLNKYHFDVGETFSMFHKLFLFSTLYFAKNKTICLKKLSGLSNSKFLFICDMHHY